MSQPQLFLDCDGVLADFDAYAGTIFGTHPRQAEQRLGKDQFWTTLETHPDFYFCLPLMPDARQLFEAVAHLNPIILTGCPEGGWAERQKERWAALHFPQVPILTCKSRDKRLHMNPGDILIDDWPAYKHLWEEAGGIFILHTSARESIDALVNLGMLPPRLGQAPATH